MELNKQYNYITYGFDVGAPVAIDARIVLTKEQMSAIEDDRMPEKYFAICLDDGKLYIYDKNTAPRDPELGKFRVYAEGSIEDVLFNGKSVVENKIAKIDVPFEIGETDGLLYCKWIEG